MRLEICCHTTLFLLTFGQVSRALYQRQTYRMTAKIRAGLISKIYQDTTTLRHADVKDSAAVTLMGTDVERIHESSAQIHEIWASSIEIVIAVWLLVRQVSYAALLPSVICLSKSHPSNPDCIRRLG